MAGIKETSFLTRRQFISTVALNATAVILLSSVPGFAGSAPRSLSFFHTHTGEKLDIQYGGTGGYDTKALVEINQFLKDFRTGEVHPIDPNLLDQLASISHAFGKHRTFEVISGFRSPKTNRQLRGKSNNVAKRSLHMKGQAIDVRLAGIQIKNLHQCALQLQCGGVGYYPKSDFIHLDTGRVRFW